MTATKADNGSEDSEKRNDLHSRQRSPEPKAGPAGTSTEPRPHEAGGHGMELLQGHRPTKAVLRTA